MLLLNSNSICFYVEISKISTLIWNYDMALFYRSQANRSVLQASQLLEETSQFRIEKFGTPLPVLITEVLTYADSKC